MVVNILRIQIFTKQAKILVSEFLISVVG